MASESKRRKAGNQARKAKRTPGRHPDGDRRRRGGLRVEDAIAQKKAMQEFPGEVPPSDNKS
jgi:hypothetical protein